MAEPTPVHPAALEPDVLLGQCQVRRGRGRGPGGQHRNKVETAVVLIHVPTGVQASASERRSQQENHRVALRRLRINLALSVRTPPPGPVSDLWRRRCASGTIRVNRDHPDYPALLAESLDRIAACDYDPKSAASAAAVSTSQLIRFLRSEPRALEQLNAQRETRGLHRLR